jgi:hypothetical protein
LELRFSFELTAPAVFPAVLLWEQSMQDMQAHLEKLLCDAEECTLISRLATDPQKKELFARLAEHLTALASEVERAIAVKLMGEEA